MKSLHLIAVAYSLVSTAQCTPRPEITAPPQAAKVLPRALACQDDIATYTTVSSHWWDTDYCASSIAPGSLTTGYTVEATPCPSSPPIRSASGLNSAEALWLSNRAPKANAAVESYLQKWLGGLDISPYDIKKLMEKPPRIGVAVSGGGYRAMLNGVGVMKGLDQLGLLDGTTYISGLSGGAWAVGSWALNNFTDMDTLTTKWNLPVDPDSLADQWLYKDNDADYCYPIQCEANKKFRSGADISFADNWSRLMARSVLSGIPGDSTWSGLASSEAFASANYPFPILLSNGQTVADNDTFPADATVYEMTPLEFGSWDPYNTGAFVPMNLIGSDFGGNACIQGLDNSAFILGSSSLAISDGLENYADFTMPESTGNVPNPFCGFGSGTENDCNTYPTLYLDDGGTNNQTIPFLPLLQPARGVDVIFAVDSSADTTYNYPFGASLNWTNYYASSIKGQKQGLAFPNRVTTAAFIQQNANRIYTPTFFGCSARDTTSRSGVIPPLIIYLPNVAYSVYPNASTPGTGTWWWHDVAPVLVENGVALATTGISTSGVPWKTCLACAIAERARLRMNPIPRQGKECQICFADYCAETKPFVSGLFDGAGNYAPPPLAGAQQYSGTYNYTSEL